MSKDQKPKTKHPRPTGVFPAFAVFSRTRDAHKKTKHGEARNLACAFRLGDPLPNRAFQVFQLFQAVHFFHSFQPFQECMALGKNETWTGNAFRPFVLRFFYGFIR